MYTAGIDIGGTNTRIALINDLYAVSYTHLDVYKRQQIHITVLHLTTLFPIAGSGMKFRKQ